MDDLSKQIPLPKSWIDFENLCHMLFRAIWNDPYTEKNGRGGQKQKGVDIFGSPKQEYSKYHGVQCKGKNTNYGSQASIGEIEKEIAKAEKFSPTLCHWIYATTSPVDVNLQEKARNISKERQKRGEFSISVFGWEQIEFLLCSHKDVLNAIYPELGLNLDAFIDELRTRLSLEIKEEIKPLLVDIQRPSQRFAKNDNHGWVPVIYGQGRGLTPALLGRSMGASDAISCPELSEVSSVIRDLSQAYTSRIVGEPGSGKSLCAFQAMKHFVELGWRVYRFIDPQREDIESPEIADEGKVLLFIDDAHLLQSTRLALLEEQAGPDLHVLSTHNAEDGRTSFRNAIPIDSKRAVNTIAKGLMLNPQKTLKEVSKIDKGVGETMMDVSIEERIEESQNRSCYPWQFCFNLGGGWLRSQGIVDAARQAGADIILAGLTIHQLVSRDQPIQLTQASNLLSCAGIEDTEARNSIKWLVNQRFLLSIDDLRTPHQRFSSVVLKQVLKAQNGKGRDAIGKILQQVISDKSHPLAGKRMLLHELRFSVNYEEWSYLIPESFLKPAIKECWDASLHEEKLHACYFLNELRSFITGWPEALYSGHEKTVASWISKPEYSMGWGLAWLLNGIGNEHKDFVTSIIIEADPNSLATAVNCVLPSTAAHLGELVSSIEYARDTEWYKCFLSKLDHKALGKLAKTWPDEFDPWAFAKFCRAISGIDEGLGLLLVDEFVPYARNVFEQNPVLAFRHMDDILWHVLRVYDPLRIYVGKLAPSRRHRQIARLMLSGLDAKKVAKELSEVRLSKMQDAAGLLVTIYKTIPAKHIAIVELINWQKVSETIGLHWGSLPHEVGVFLGACYGNGSTKNILNQFVLDNLEKIKLFPPRVAALSPEAVIKHVEAGKEVRIASYDHVNWTFGYIVLALFAEKSPSLIGDVLRPAEKTISRTFSMEHHSWFKSAYDCTKLLSEVAPLSLQRILDDIDVTTASIGWLNSLRYGKDARKTVALLIELSLTRKDQLGDLAHSLRKRFPKVSRHT